MSNKINKLNLHDALTNSETFPILKKRQVSSKPPQLKT